MSKTIAQIIAEAEEIRVETDPNGNTADRVGTAIKDVAEHVEGVEEDVSQQSGDISTLQETVADIEQELASQSVTIDDIEDALYYTETIITDIADESDLADYTYYVLNGTSVSTADGSSNHISGLEFECNVGDIFIIATKGGYQAARAWGVANADGVVLARSESSLDTLDNPLELTITQSGASKLYVNMYGLTDRDKFKVQTKVVQRTTQKDFVTFSDLSSINAKDTEQDEKIADLNNEVFEPEYHYTQIADVDDLSDSEWWALTGTKASKSTNMTLGYKGWRKAVQKGEIYRITTYGGTTSGSARAYAIGMADGTILEVAPASPRDYITNPKVVTITQDDAAWLYVNCHSSHYNDFKIESASITYTSRISDIDTRLSDVEEEIGAGLWHLKSNTALLIGASFAYSENTWFEQACERLKLTPINKAVSGSKIQDDAVRIYNGTLFNDVNDFDVFVMMHVHNKDVATLPDGYADKTVAEYESDTDFWNAMNNNQGFTDNQRYALAFDYVIKKYQDLCYAQRENSASPWYNVKSGKPVVIVMCSSWHDARVTYNTSSKLLAERWGLHYCDFASNIGFSKDKIDYATGEQASILYTAIVNPTEVIGGVTYGWHPARGRNEYIQQLMAHIASDAIKEVFW